MHDIYAFPLSKKDYFVAETTDEKIDRMCQEALQEIADMAKDAIAKFLPQDKPQELRSLSNMIDICGYNQAAAMSNQRGIQHASMGLLQRCALSQLGLAQYQPFLNFRPRLERIY